MSTQPIYLRGRGRGRGTVPQNPLNFTSPQQGQGQFLIQNGIRPVRPGQKNSPSNGPTATSSTSPGVENHLEASLKSVEDIFAKARSKHFESAQQHLTKIEVELDESDDEEDIGSLVLNGVFQSYAKTFESENRNDVQSAQEKLLHSFRSGTSACLVCIETIKKEDAIWNCQGCYCMFHITCIQKWVREGVYQKQYSSGDFVQEKPSAPISWHCPKCRYEYSQSECPTTYNCFCGKVDNPKFDPWLVPHSCGAKCGRKLQPACGHSCLLLCHPGACPPCPVMITSTCYCEKSTPRMVRCSVKSWSCGKICGRLLSCKQHKCPEKCHSGVCPPCVKTSIHPCLCGKEKVERPCDSISWQCEKKCGKSLNCGNHVCELVCHTGKCGNCPRSGLRKCPCGKTEFQLPCIEDIPTCGDTCGKPLACGQHTCTGRCHLGDCGQCMQMSVKRCRCGQRQKEVPCAKEFLCEKKCNNMRNCGVHKCNRKCCDGNCPSCEQICGKTLKCRNHKCASRCHKGPCYPCPLTVSITCNCQATKISVPCGKERETKPPRCNLPFGNHLNVTIHLARNIDATLGTVLHGIKAGPWDTKPTIIQKVAKQCPPCQFPISIQCIGKHETSEIPCFRVKPYSCGRICGRRLTCGNHVCQLACHKVSGTENDAMAGEECQKCEMGCEAKRPAGCTHPCVKPCHPPPCPPCHMMIRMRCHCQTLVKHIECVKWVSASEVEKDFLKSCEQPCPKEMPCSHPCGATCHNGTCPNTNKCDKKVVLKCKCRRIKKEISCKDKDITPKPECDDNCKSKTQNVNETTKIKEEEDLKKQEAELLEFERMMRGRKKKPRKHKEEVEEDSAFRRYKFHIIFVLGLLTAFCVALYFTYY
ncbi:NF-X1-type zinc finger protein nfxl1 [Bulinus truncatus]|nr:NF-X1-type zinc finger protein nfxl1 [Bulinus truncatus]